jgi:tRNA threonylcarbamoyladenosine biosynthesis protein TsaE
VVFIVDKEAELEQIAQQILREHDGQRVFTFSGNLGSGKTTFIKYLCKALGVKQQVNSPTFALVNEYRIANGLKVFHFDFYRIKNVQEAYDIGYEEYFYSGDYCFIEWPEMIEDIIPDNVVEIKIEFKEGKREITIN